MYYKVVDTVIATASSYTDPVKIEGFSKLAVSVVTFGTSCETAAACLEVQAANTSTTSSFASVKTYGVYSAGTGILTWEVPSSVGAYTVICPPGLEAFKYMRLKLAVNTTTCATTVGRVYMCT